MPPDLSPWHQRMPAELGHDDPHDEATCPVCGPVVASDAYRAGAARAHVVQTHLPMTSAGHQREQERQRAAAPAGPSIVINMGPAQGQPRPERDMQDAARRAAHERHLRG